MNRIYWGEAATRPVDACVEGAIVEVDGTSYYRVSHYDRMPPFLMSIVSSSDLWMFVSSSGGLTCGRGSPDLALFPYETDDRIHDSAHHAGPRTCFLVERPGRKSLWIPFAEGAPVYATERNLYKSVIGSRLVFEEVNHDLGLVFSYAWAPGDRFGFTRTSRVRNTGATEVSVELLDGFRNILPPGIGQDMQARLSTLMDAYKVSEIDADSGAGVYSLSSLPTDRAEPKEALQASLVCNIGLDRPVVLLSENQLGKFCSGQAIEPETRVNGQRGAYFVNSSITLQPGQHRDWVLLADTGLCAAALTSRLRSVAGDRVRREVERDIAASEQRLQELAGAADGFQFTADERVSGRHFANTLFNIMRGGTFVEDYRIPRDDLLDFVHSWNAEKKEPFSRLLDTIEEPVTRQNLVDSVEATDDPDLKRLALEYLPLIFSRRHGDPSRPWNKFNIEIRDEDGTEKLGYQGNWRDIFQNWEALGFSYPEFIENFIARFVNTSTIDGYNPYRVGRDGFDWEVLDEDDGWSNIGYWGDHQVVYLLRLLELSRRYAPDRILRFLEQKIFVYADVPYRIKPYRDLIANPRDSIVYDSGRAKQLMARAEEVGADGKLLTLEDGSICRANLLEKLLVTVLAKLCNFAPGGGIWMNTQRPEWNDANNALAGYGLSMVTVCYLYRFTRFFRELVQGTSAGSFEVSDEIARLLQDLNRVFDDARESIDDTFSPAGRKAFMDRLGQAGSDYRERVYGALDGAQATVEARELTGFLDCVGEHLRATIENNRKPDGLYHSYNLLEFESSGHHVLHLDAMLEGQVAVLGSGLLTPQESLGLLHALKESDLYRADQQSFMLYPERIPVGFMDRNRIPPSVAENSAVVRRELASGRRSLVLRDSRGQVRFNSAFATAHDLQFRMEQIGGLTAAEKEELADLYEHVFCHHGYTGRSSTMFKYEGLGSIYWHMVSKLLLAVGEIYTEARHAGADAAVLNGLAESFDEIKDGLGVKKSPGRYGAIPLDPYSHTPAFAGAQQPGMTGQVKEDFLNRFNELGVEVREGCVVFEPSLLGQDEFSSEPGAWSMSTGNGFREERLEASSVAFSVCGTPVVYRLADERRIEVHSGDDTPVILEGSGLDRSRSRSLFERDGRIRKLIVDIPRSSLRGTGS